jgi:hypothetical protein
MRSEIGLEDQSPDSLTGMVTGRHDVHVQLGLGPDRAKGLSADLIARGRFHHLGQTRRALGPVDIGAGAHTETALSLSAAPRLTEKAHGVDASGFTIPVTAALRHIDYLDRDAEVSRAFTRSMAMGIGARMLDRHAVDLLIQFVSLSHAHRARARAAPGHARHGRGRADRRGAGVRPHDPDHPAHGRARSGRL